MSYFNKEQFSLVPEVVRICFMYWHKKKIHGTFSPKNKRDSLAYAFPRFWSATCIVLTFDGYTGLSVNCNWLE